MVVMTEIKFFVNSVSIRLGLPQTVLLSNFLLNNQLRSASVRDLLRTQNWDRQRKVLCAKWIWTWVFRTWHCPSTSCATSTALKPWWSIKTGTISIKTLVEVWCQNYQTHFSIASFSLKELPQNTLIHNWVIQYHQDRGVGNPTNMKAILEVEFEIWMAGKMLNTLCQHTWHLLAIILCL